MRINDKIDEIENYLLELDEIMPKSYKDYLEDKKTKAACERYFEKILESIVDLAFLIIKEKGFKTPEDDKNAFDILTYENILSLDLSKKLKDAKGMRNILAQEYGKVDDSIVFESITEELISDAKDFLILIKKLKF